MPPAAPCGQPSSATFTASETGFTGTFTAVSADTTVATVAPSSPAGTFKVTSTVVYQPLVPEPGTFITVSDGTNTAKENVSTVDCLP